MTMSTILSSRFVAGIRGEVEKVERQLTNFCETLDQWVQVREALVAARCCATLLCALSTAQDMLLPTCNLVTVDHLQCATLKHATP